MAITVPPFTQYQAPMYPLRALWNSAPPEGDRFISCEIDWGVTTPLTEPAVQIALSGNSPVAFSQIVALSVDNARCGSDVQFVFTDSGFVLQIPGYTQGVYPVFTNALMFYVVGLQVALEDVTTFQVLNSMPPPVAIQSSSQQEQANNGNVLLTANGNVNIIPPTISGTLEGFSITLNLTQPTPSANVNVSLIDGAGHVLWQTNYSGAVPATVPFNVSPIRVRFTQGINVNVAFTTVTSGWASVNLYYSVP